MSSDIDTGLFVFDCQSGEVGRMNRGGRSARPCRWRILFASLLLLQAGYGTGCEEFADVFVDVVDEAIRDEDEPTGVKQEPVAVIIGGKVSLVDPASADAINRIQALQRKSPISGNREVKTDGAMTGLKSLLDFTAKADADAWTLVAISKPESDVFFDALEAVALPGKKALAAGGFAGGASSNQASAVAFLYDGEADVWTQLPDMNDPRTRHTMTLLDDGRVLIAGGFDGNLQLGSAELFDPTTMTFTPTPAMNQERSQHTAARLPDGRVLIAGGDMVTGATSEIYDPQTNSFTPAANTVAQARVSVALQDGRILLAGAFETLEAQTFDPTTGQYTLTGDLNEAHGVFPTMTAMPDGRVLLAGGLDLNRDETAATDIFDPATNSFSVGPVMSTERNSHSAVLLPDGLIALIGGASAAGETSDTVDLFDPSDNTMTVMTERMAGGRSRFAAVTLTP
jgi:hypothetical protein